jgi:hypothetical protein
MKSLNYDPNLCSSLRLKDQVSHPHKISGAITIDILHYLGIYYSMWCMLYLKVQDKVVSLYSRLSLRNKVSNNFSSSNFIRV